MAETTRRLSLSNFEWMAAARLCELAIAARFRKLGEGGGGADLEGRRRDRVWLVLSWWVSSCMRRRCSRWRLEGCTVRVVVGIQLVVT